MGCICFDSLGQYRSNEITPQESSLYLGHPIAHQFWGIWAFAVEETYSFRKILFRRKAVTFDSTPSGPCDIDNFCNASIPSLIENHFEFDKMDVFRVSSPFDIYRKHNNDLWSFFASKKSLKSIRKEENYKNGETCMVSIYKYLYYNNLIVIRCV